jgi:hypothetical protein
MTDNYSIISANFSDVEADARLIAAAPDLLAALEKVQDWMEGGSNIHTAKRYVTNALNKAKKN